MNSNAVILGGVALNIGVVDVFHRMGYFVIAVDYRKNINLKCDLHIVFDAKDPNIVSELHKFGIDSIDIVYTSMDEAGLAQRALCKEYGLYYASEEAMNTAHNKSLMHNAWKKAGILNRESQVLQNLDKDFLICFNKKYKTIIKPADSCGSKGITILDQNSSIENLESAFMYALNFSPSKNVNIEEFIDGIEYSVEMIGDNFGNVTIFGIGEKYHTTNAKNNRIANKVLYNSSKFSNKFIHELCEIATQCYTSIGLKNTFGHLEIIQKVDGTYSPIEIGARSSAFIASHLVDVCCNKSFLKEYRNVLHGKSLENKMIPPSNISSMYYFYDMQVNKTIQKSYNITDFLPQEIVSLYHDRSKLQKNTMCSLLINDTDRYGYEILIGPQKILTIDTVLKAEEKFYKEIFYENNE